MQRRCGVGAQPRKWTRAAEHADRKSPEHRRWGKMRHRAFSASVGVAAESICAPFGKIRSQMPVGSVQEALDVRERARRRDVRERPCPIARDTPMSPGQRVAGLQSDADAIRYASAAAAPAAIRVPNLRAPPRAFRVRAPRFRTSTASTRGAAYSGVGRRSRRPRATIRSLRARRARYVVSAIQASMASVTARNRTSRRPG